MGCTTSVGKKNLKEINFFIEKVEQKIYLVINEEDYEIDKLEFSLNEYYFNDLKNNEKINFELKSKICRENFIKYINLYKNFNVFNTKTEFVNFLFYKNPKKFKNILAYSGVPQKYRVYFWIKVMNIDYNIFVKNYEHYVNKEDKEVKDQVLKDVKRTLQHKSIFKENQPGFILLYKICKALGSYLEKTKYVQGMNFIVSSILEITGFREHLTFEIVRKWMVKKDYMFLYIFNTNFPMIKFLRNIYREIMNKKMKKLITYLDNIYFSDELWFFKWYISLFCNYFPKYYCTRFLDYITSGDLFSLCYLTLSISKNLEKNILQMNFEQLNELFKDNDKLMNILEVDKVITDTKLFKLTKDQKEKYLKNYWTKIENEKEIKLEDSIFIEKLKKYIPEVSEKVKIINKSGYSNLPKVEESISVLNNQVI